MNSLNSSILDVPKHKTVEKAKVAFPPHGLLHLQCRQEVANLQIIKLITIDTNNSNNHTAYK